jgi:hypothetical protein
MERAEPTPTFFASYQHYADSALHSTLFNYTPNAIWGTDKNKQLTIIKPTQTGINRNK